MEPPTGEIIASVATVHSVRLKRGTDLVQATIEALSERQIGNAWLDGQGTFVEIELQDGREPSRTFATASRIVALHGRAEAGAGCGEIRFSATVVRSAGLGVELLTGSVIRGEVGDVDLLIVPIDAMRSRVADQRGRSEDIDNNTAVACDENDPARALVDSSKLRVNASTGKDKRADAATPSAWKQVASASAREPQVSPAASGSRRGEAPGRGTGPTVLAPPTPPLPPPRRAIDDAPYPEAGDLVDHFAFGRCLVIRSDGDELAVQDSTTGRMRTLRLSVLRVHPPAEEDGKRVYRLVQRR